MTERLAALCAHSVHPSRGCSTPRELECRYGKGQAGDHAGYRVVAFFKSGNTAQQLSCVGCEHFIKEGDEA